MSKHATSRARRGRPHGPPGTARAADQPFTLPGDGAESLGLRAQRLSHILFEELYRLFRLEVNDPRLADVVPSSVEVSPDLRSARVLYSLRNPPEQSEAYKTARTPGMARALVNEAVRAINDGLTRVTPFLRARLRDAVSLRYMPELHFHRDRIAESTLRAVETLSPPVAPRPAPPPEPESDSEPEAPEEDEASEATAAPGPHAAAGGTDAS
ncbi:MAG: ribosome-binding factor A [Polyangia bacterium]